MGISNTSVTTIDEVGGRGASRPERVTCQIRGEQRARGGGRAHYSGGPEVMDQGNTPRRSRIAFSTRERERGCGGRGKKSAEREGVA